MTPQHVLDAQREYASRKWLAGHNDKYCSTYHRFAKFSDAIAYLRDQAARVARDNLSDMQQSMEGPGGVFDVSPLLKKGAR